jgi:CBS domain-containing protein
MSGWRRLAGPLLAPALWLGGLFLIVLGEAIAGLALVMAGWFARTAARAARRREQLEHVVDGVTVGEVMETSALVVAPHATLDTFGDAIDPAGPTTVARVTRDGGLVGLIGIAQLDRVPRARWPIVHAAEAMVGVEALPALRPGEALRPVADRLGASSAPGFPVYEDAQLAGILTRLGVGRVVDERASAREGKATAGAGKEA